MIKDICKFCNEPCEITLIDLYHDSAGFKAGTPVSECCKADFEEMSLEDQVEFDQEQWDKNAWKSIGAREKLAKMCGFELEDEPVNRED